MNKQQMHIMRNGGPYRDQHGNLRDVNDPYYKLSAEDFLRINKERLLEKGYRVIICNTDETYYCVETEQDCKDKTDAIAFKVAIETFQTVTIGKTVASLIN